MAAQVLPKGHRWPDQGVTKGAIRPKSAQVGDAYAGPMTERFA